MSDDQISLAANMGGPRDLDSASYIRLPRTSDLVLVLQRRGQEKPFGWWLQQHVHRHSGGQRTLFALPGLAPNLGYQAQRLELFFFLLIVNVSGSGG